MPEPPVPNAEDEWETQVPPRAVDVWESLDIALRIVDTLDDAPPEAFNAWRKAARTVITDSSAPVIRWQEPDRVWLAWLALRAVESIVDGMVDWDHEAPAAIVRVRTIVLGRSWVVGDDWDPSDALAEWDTLMAWAVRWATHAPAQPEAITPSPQATDPAWGALTAAWPSLDLADRARIADFAQRLARK